MTEMNGTPGYVGRFAPSPTGDLHFGSLVAAVGSYLQAKANGGYWLLRIEDIDPPREVPGSASRILDDLQRLGLNWDGEVLYQSQRLKAYDAAIDRLLANKDAFCCGCSRSDLPAGQVYPGTCRNGIGRNRQPRSIRMRVRSEVITFTDAVMGRQSQQLASDVGDFVIQRADDLPAYQLAVVVDDAFQGVTEVVRGADLLNSTSRQIWLQHRLGIPRPGYLHLPLVVLGDGKKLSKCEAADPVRSMTPAGAVQQALSFLGQQPPAIQDLEGLWVWAIDNWRPAAIPASPAIPAPRVNAQED